jgi:nucleotide-binding universal stress UspA family protein
MHILYATDGSEGARIAGDALVRVPFPPDTRLTLLHVLARYVPSEMNPSHALLERVRADEDARAGHIIDEARRPFEAAGWQVEAQVTEGHPARSITEFAEAGGHDLIVTGAMGVSGWMRALMGSTSAGVVKHAPCPVWVVKRPPKQGRMDILVASDGSAHARHAIATLCRIPFPPGTVVHLLHVVPSLNDQLRLTGSALDPPVLEPLYEIGRHFRLHGEHLLKEDAETLGAAFSEVRPFLEEGEARRRILSAAEAVEADLIVVGSKGISGIREFILGSVSHKVLKHTRASVLIAPLPGQ